MTTYLLIGIVCGVLIGLALWIIYHIKPAPFEPQTPEFDDARISSIRAELDSQEMKTKRVRAAT